MSALEIVFTVVGVAAAVLLLVASAYFLLIPRLLVRMLRKGGDNLTFPENFAETTAAVTVESDCAYPSRFPNASYDLYLPAGDGKKPLLLWVHGGFFLAGDKSGVRNVAASLASRGIAVAAMNYAVAPETKYPAAIVQIDELLRHLKDSDSRLDFDRVAIAGDSAGGQLASQYAALVTSPALQDRMKRVPALKKESLKCAVLVCAPIEIAALRGVNRKLDRLLPMFGRAYYGKGKWYRSDRFADTRTPRFVTPDYPPTFLTDGNHVSFESQNRSFGSALRDRGVRTVELYFDPADAQVEHEYLFDLATDRAAAALQSIATFLQQNLIKADNV